MSLRSTPGTQPRMSRMMFTNTAPPQPRLSMTGKGGRKMAIMYRKKSLIFRIAPLENRTGQGCV